MDPDLRLSEDKKSPSGETANRRKANLLMLQGFVYIYLSGLLLINAAVVCLNTFHNRADYVG